MHIATTTTFNSILHLLTSMLLFLLYFKSIYFLIYMHESVCVSEQLITSNTLKCNWSNIQTTWLEKKCEAIFFIHVIEKNVELWHLILEIWNENIHLWMIILVAKFSRNNLSCNITVLLLLTCIKNLLEKKKIFLFLRTELPSFQMHLFHVLQTV